VSRKLTEELAKILGCAFSGLPVQDQRRIEASYLLEGSADGPVDCCSLLSTVADPT
jgi:hypothetical protein